MESTEHRQKIAVGVIAILAIAWGALPLFVRIDVPSLQLVGVRVTFGALALLGVVIAIRRLTFPKVRRWRLALAGLLLALHWITFFESIKLTTVAIALSTLYLGPIAASILSGPLLREKVAPRLWVALVVAVFGTILVIQPQQSGGVDSAGIVMAALSAVLLVAVTLVGKPIARELGGLTMATGELVTASILLAPFTFEALTQHREHLIDFLILGAVFTGIAGAVYWSAMTQVSVAAVSVVMYLEPVSAVIWAAAFLGEIPNVVAGIGILLVISGGFVAATTTGKYQDAVGTQSAL